MGFGGAAAHNAALKRNRAMLRGSGAYFKTPYKQRPKVDPAKNTLKRIRYTGSGVKRSNKNNTAAYIRKRNLLDLLIYGTGFIVAFVGVLYIVRNL